MCRPNAPNTPHSKRSPDLLKRRRVQLYVASFLADTAGHGYPLVVAQYALDALGASAFHLGLLGAVRSVSYGAVCLILAGWSDRVGSMPLVRGSLLVLSFAAMPLTLSARSLPLLYLANALVGVALGLFWPPLQRELSLLSPGPLLWRALGAFNLYWAAGAAAGAFAALPAYVHFGFTRAIVFCAVLFLLALLCTLWRRGHELAVRGALEPEAVHPAKARLFLHLAWLANFAGAFAIGAMHDLFVYVGDRYLLTTASVSAIVFAKEIGRFAAFAFLRRFSGWHYSLAWLAAGQGLAAAALLAGGFVRNPAVLFALFALVGGFVGLTYYSSFYYGLNLRQEEGRKSGLHEGILAAGIFLGPLASGAAGDLLPRWPGVVLFLPGTVLLVVLALTLAMARRRGRSLPADPETDDG